MGKRIKKRNKNYVKKTFQEEQKEEKQWEFGEKMENILSDEQSNRHEERKRKILLFEYKHILDQIQ